MRVVVPSKENYLEWQHEPLTSGIIDKFRMGTASHHSKGVPLSLPTIFRQPEFDWLARLEVDMRELLHTEQSYQYVRPLREGDSPLIRTWVSGFKERKGKQLTLYLIEFTSDVYCDGEKVVTSTTNFVIRSGSSAVSEEK